MPFQPAPGIIEVALRFTSQGQRAVNVFHVGPNFGEQTVDIPTVSVIFSQWYQQYLRPIQHETTVLNEFVLTDLSVEAGQQLTLPMGENNTGNLIGIAAPNNVTIAVSLRTGLRGRSYRGRVYHVGLAQSQIQGNFLTPAAAASIREAYDTLVTQMSDGEGGDLVVLSRQLNNATRATAIGTPILSATLTDTTIDSQRRRLPGRGA